MYAVIRAGGKQHKVKPGDVIEVELTRGTAGEAVTFTPLLVVDDEGHAHYGKALGRARVKGRLVGEEKGHKVRILKYRPKTGYVRRQGHRQLYTLVEIEEVSLGRRAAPKKAEADGAEEGAAGPETPRTAAATTASPPGPDEAPGAGDGGAQG
jgi:large subunit ribosomal protein L21